MVARSVRMVPHTMLDEMKYEGLWWLPSEADKKVPGTLKFTQAIGALLEITGSLSASDGLIESAVILGVSTDGKEITLRECFETHRSVHVPGMEASVFLVTEVFIGAHFGSASDIKFDLVSVGLAYLDEWVDRSGLEIQVRVESSEAGITYRTPSPISLLANNLWTVAIAFMVRYPSMGPSGTSAEIAQEARLIIDS